MKDRTRPCIHDYVDFSDPSVPMLRKGAISAKEGERVIIPINMRDRVFAISQCTKGCILAKKTVILYTISWPE